MAKGEIANNEQFLLFPQCFLPVSRTFCHFHQNWNCRPLTLSIWKSLKFVVWERVKLIIQYSLYQHPLFPKLIFFQDLTWLLSSSWNKNNSIINFYNLCERFLHFTTHFTSRFKWPTEIIYIICKHTVTVYSRMCDCVIHRSHIFFTTLHQIPVTDGEKNIGLDRDSNPGPQEYRPCTLPLSYWTMCRSASRYITKCLYPTT